jgi:hypothetical protein
MNMRWLQHVAYMGEIKNAYNILYLKLEREESLGGQDEAEQYDKYVAWMWTGLNWFRIVPKHGFLWAL